jgi:hypothetical protein
MQRFDHGYPVIGKNKNLLLYAFRTSNFGVIASTLLGKVQGRGKPKNENGCDQ